MFSQSNAMPSLCGLVTSVVMGLSSSNFAKLHVFAAV
jgi:hypothetical protein